jgi:hypothetical protein
MAQRPARIESPELIQALRNRWVAFDRACHNTLMSFLSDVDETREWLRSDRPAYWKQQLRKREEELLNAKREHAQSQWASERGGPNQVETLRALERAKQRKEEVERKIETVKKCALLLEHKIAKELGPCHALGILMDQRTPQALARLDRMRDGLDAYFRPSPPEAPPS